MRLEVPSSASCGAPAARSRVVATTVSGNAAQTCRGQCVWCLLILCTAIPSGPSLKLLQYAAQGVPCAERAFQRLCGFASVGVHAASGRSPRGVSVF